MRVITELENIYWNRPTVLTLGKFNGLHRGHQTLITGVKEKAVGLNADAVVISFGISRECLLSPEEKRNMLTELGMDGHIECPFVPEIIMMEAEDFVRNILFERLHVRHIVVGESFRFGHRRTGDTNLLKALGETLGYTVEVLPQLEEAGEIISSTRIRAYLAEGRIEEAQKLLGYPYFVSGKILHGRRIGRTIGFPTTNIIPDREKVLPPMGVYFVRSYVKGQCHNGIANLGTKPTVNGGFVGIETHLFGIQEELYGQRQKVELLHFARPEQKFPDLETLTRQIQADREAALDYFQI